MQGDARDLPLFPEPRSQLVPDPHLTSPTEDPICTGGQPPKHRSHMSAPRTPRPTHHPPSHPESALPHQGRPSIIKKVKCDEVRWRTQRTHASPSRQLLSNLNFTKCTNSKSQYWIVPIYFFACHSSLLLSLWTAPVKCPVLTCIKTS